MKNRVGFRKRKHPGRSWLGTKLRPGFQGYPLATIAFYGPTDELASKVVVSVFLTETHEPNSLQTWLSQDDLDVRVDERIGEQVCELLKSVAPRSIAALDRIIGCPHQEGIDYPEGSSCPQCPFWAGRDRFTHDRIQ